MRISSIVSTLSTWKPCNLSPAERVGAGQSFSDDIFFSFFSIFDQFLKAPVEALCQIIMEAVAVGVHGDNPWESVETDIPEGLGQAEFLRLEYVQYFHDGGGVVNAGPPDPVQINSPMLFAGGKGARSHPTLADYETDAKGFDYLILIYLVTDARRPSCG